MAPRTLAYLGCRTTRARGADGAGLTIWDVSDGTWHQVGLLAADEDERRGGAPLPANPTFLLVVPRTRTMYVTHGDTDRVSVLDLAEPAAPTVRQIVRIGRRNPVDLALAGGRLVVTCLTGPGGLVGLPIAADGSLGAPDAMIDVDGTPGPMQIQQAGSSPHQAVLDPSGSWLLVPDRAADAIHGVPADLDTAHRGLRSSPVRQAEGPRHLAFHPGGRWAYVVTELRSSVVACEWDAVEGVLTPVQIVSATADDVTGDSCAAEIAVTPDGRAVVVSNRSGSGDRVPPTLHADSLGWFPIEADGRLGPGRWVSSGGQRPRHFAFSPSGRLVAVHQWDGAVVAFDVAQDGLSAGLPVARTGTPTCVAWWSELDDIHEEKEETAS